ncbi:S-adenosyl-L-methionine-dependent methyltransferase [Fimicolochytrium jonesii]|uniref:S-adenosyl-L-methionine-dependent methyltransferase n=1 Tax=Fimicolochytrium jonesii TaxID=1396493 RepID=UPI0022FEE217|nr:S-adenosyl-L-methionine-dependent methyltransferase [Fimicolochytrium jonesii]KAI8824411.1 S-adenosyl-L-methionine-dependent methyltransferase [Fimicolochytrium jonesii]
MKERLQLAEALVKPTGSLWLNLGYTKAYNGQHFPLSYHFWDAFATLELRQEVIWHTHRGIRIGRDPYFDLEAVRAPHDQKTCTYGTRKGVKRCNPRGKNPSDVWLDLDLDTTLWDVSSVAAGEGRSSAERVAHPAQMPQEILERIIKACSPAKGSVLDRFAGSGSTLIAAIRCGREADGIEISPEYVALARELEHEEFQGRAKWEFNAVSGYDDDEDEAIKRFRGGFDGNPTVIVIVDVAPDAVRGNAVRTDGRSAAGRWERRRHGYGIVRREWWR